MPETVGVLALQGDFARHIESLRRIGITTREVRTPQDLSECTRLILPGGESTTLGLLLRSSGLDDALREAHKNEMPLWGTCMGMILLAKDIEDSDQFRFGFMDITVRRNAFGAQVHSFEKEIPFKGIDDTFHAIFIRAPEVTRCGEHVEPLAETEGRIVAVRQGRLLGTAFHPELTQDTRIHELFCTL